jgi:hypothetical protein
LSCIIGGLSRESFWFLLQAYVSKAHVRLVGVLFAIAALHIMTPKWQETSRNELAELSHHAVRIKSLMNWRSKKRAALLLFTGLLAIFSLGATTERTVYSQVSNKVLKQKSFQLVKDIRRLVDSYKQKDRELMTEYDRKDGPGTSKGGAHALRRQWLKDSDSAHDSTMRYYKDHYWADAILLIGELNRRLSKRAKQPELLRLYQHPTNVLGLAAIADHLELHSKLLPDS